MGQDTDQDLLSLTVRIVAAHVGHNRVSLGDVPGLVRLVYRSLQSASDATSGINTPRAPAVPVDQSVKHDYIVCLEDGKKLRMLRRYLMTQHGLTPDQYRARWGLPADYPMVAPASAERRRVRGGDK